MVSEISQVRGLQSDSIKQPKEIAEAVTGAFKNSAGQI